MLVFTDMIVYGVKQNFLSYFVVMFLGKILKEARRVFDRAVNGFQYAREQIFLNLEAGLFSEDKGNLHSLL